GHLSIATTLALVIVSALIGASIGYWIGRVYGTRELLAIASAPPPHSLWRTAYPAGHPRPSTADTISGGLRAGCVYTIRRS
ncbi:hypothetical protein, partial [Nocardia sp. NPDC004722]